jgi:hypothetical protein
MNKRIPTTPVASRLMVLSFKPSDWKILGAYGSIYAISE